MTCEELAHLLPDLVDGTLSSEKQAEAELALQACPEVQRELEIARHVRTFLQEFQAEHADIQLPAGFEVRLLARIRHQHTALEVLDLSSKAFGLWLIEFLNLLGELFDPSMGAETHERLSREL